MAHSSPTRTRQLAAIAVIAGAIGLLSIAVREHPAHESAKVSRVTETGDSRNAAEHSSTAQITNEPLHTAAPERVLTLSPDTVLASVNHRSLTAGDVLPPGASNQPISPEVCEYYLQRAIDRELIFQTARERGLELDSSQKQQLVNYATMRGQHGPGVVQDLNGSSAESSFQLRDAEAFMLQTSLMEQLGISPNVTADQVMAYYQQHASEFGQLPADKNARDEVWNNIDFEIRKRLAASVRDDYQKRLTDYMKQLYATANVQKVL